MNVKGRPCDLSGALLAFRELKFTDLETEATDPFFFQVWEGDFQEDLGGRHKDLMLHQPHPGFCLTSPSQTLHEGFPSVPLPVGMLARAVPRLLHCDDDARLCRGRTSCVVTAWFIVSALQSSNKVTSLSVGGVWHSLQTEMA